MIRRILLSLICSSIVLWSGAATASPLSGTVPGALRDRLAQFPDWQTKPIVQAAKGDLGYPDWFAGDWQVRTTLIDLAAPLAPEILTPGFESNRAYLNQPIPFAVRFVKAGRQLVSDRAYNGLNLAKAYLGDRPVLAVKVDPNNPNRQITILRDDRQLVSTVTGRATESPDSNTFLTIEVFQQEFRGAPQLYFNTVETTTAYQHLAGNPEITADQVTAIYLSPQDPDYFKAVDRPVALYRYRLEFQRDSVSR